MASRVYSCDAKDAATMKRLMEYDPYLDKSLNDEQIIKIKGDPDANIIFARQDYQIKDGISLGLDRERSYLVLSATDDFIERADKKLKTAIPSIQRLDADTEKKVISTIEDERSASEQGIGSLFG